MITVVKYGDLFNIKEREIRERMEHDFMGFWDMYGDSYGLMEYQLGELGELVYLENEDDTRDLSWLGYKGTFTEQLFEFIEKEGEVYKAVLIRDNDGGTIFYSKAGTLDAETEKYLEMKVRENK